VIHEKNEDYAKAIEEYNLAIKADPEAEYAYLSRADVYFKKKNYQAAIEDYTKYFSLEIKDNKLLFSSRTNVAAAYCNRAYAYHMLKKHSEAIEDYTKVLMIDPSINGVENSLREVKEQKRIAGFMSQNLDSLTLPDGRTIRYEYDDYARLTKISYPGMKDATYAHNDFGYLTYMSDETGGTILAYDQLNRLEKVTLPDGKEVSYSWDDNGRVTAITYPGGSRVVYTRDSQGRLSGISNRPGKSVNYEYDARGRAAQKNLPNGVKVNYDYDDKGNLRSLSVNAPGGKLFDFKYTLDALGNYTQVMETGPDNSKTQTAYSYDPLYRLKSVVGSDGTSSSYNYDHMGNRSFVGQAVENRQASYHYDQLNRLIKVDYPDGKHKSFSYDSMGRRVGMVDTRGRVTNYIYNGNNLIQEADRRGKTVAEYTYAFGSNSPVSMRRNNQDYYYIYDHVGSVIGLTDTKGSLVSHYQYDAWGNITKEIGKIENPFRFKGMQWDSQSRLYCSGENKYYAPDLGRFINKSLADETRILNPGENSYAPIAISNPVTPVVAQPAQEIGLILEPETFFAQDDAGQIIGGLGTSVIGEATAANIGIGRVGSSWAGIGGAAVFNTAVVLATANQEALITGRPVSSVISKNMALDVFFPAAGGFLALACTSNPIGWAVLLGSAVVGFAGKAYYNFQTERLERQYGVSLTGNPPINSSLNKDIGGGGQSGAISGAQASKEVGGILFDRAADVLYDLGDITGAYWDEELGQIVLISEQKTKAQEFYLPKMDKDLLAAVIRALASQGGLSLSIDPPFSYYKTGKMPGSFTPMTVRYSPGIKDTLLGAIMYKSDKLLKNLNAGADNETGKRVIPSVPGYKNELELMLEAIAKEKWSSSWHRIWFEIGDMSLNLDTRESSGRRALKFDQAFLEVRSEYVNPYLGTNPAAEGFAEHFTLHFDEFAQEYPILERLRKLAKVTAIAKYLQQTGRLGDLSYLRQQDIRRVPTPFTTPGIKSVRTRRYSGGGWTVKSYGGIDFNFQYKSRADNGEAENLAASAKKARPISSVLRWDFEAEGKNQSALAIPMAVKGGYTTTCRDVSSGGAELIRVYNSLNNNSTMFGRGWGLRGTTDLGELSAAGIKLDFDQLERVSKITLENGRIIYYDYDRYGDLVRVRDNQEKTIRYAYDSEHRLVKIKDEAGKVVLRQNYDSLGRVIRKRQETTLDSQGKAITRSYDRQYRLTKEEDGQGNSVSYEYDEGNNLRKTIMLGSSTKKTTFEHDIEERITKVTYHSGRNVSLTYDKLGNKTSFTDQNANTTGFGYDVEGKLVSITDAAGATTKYGYDDSGSLNSVTYPNGQIIYYEYNPETRSLRIRKETNSDLIKPEVEAKPQPGNKGDVRMKGFAILPILPLIAGTGSLFYSLTGHTAGGFVLGLLCMLVGVCGIIIVMRYLMWLLLPGLLTKSKTAKAIHLSLEELISGRWSSCPNSVFVAGEIEGKYKNREVIFKIVEPKGPYAGGVETYLLLKPNTAQTQNFPVPSMSFHFSFRRYTKVTENTYLKKGWLIHKPKLAYDEADWDFYKDKQRLTQALEELTRAAEIIEAKPSVEDSPKPAQANPKPGDSQGDKQGHQGNFFRNQIQRVITVMKKKIIQIRRKIKIAKHYVLNFKSQAPPAESLSNRGNDFLKSIFSSPAVRIFKEKIKNTIFCTNGR